MGTLIISSTPLANGEQNTVEYALTHEWDTSWTLPQQRRRDERDHLPRTPRHLEQDQGKISMYADTLSDETMAEAFASHALAHDTEPLGVQYVAERAGWDHFSSEQQAKIDAEIAHRSEPFPVPHSGQRS